MAGFIRFPGALIGECNQSGYLGWIELNSVGEMIRRPVETGRVGSARYRSGTVAEDLQIEKEVDLASVGILNSCAAGVVLPAVLIDLCVSVADSITNEKKTHPHLKPYLKYTLEDVLITEINMNAGGLDDGQVPTESLTLNFDRISWEYIPIGLSVKMTKSNTVESVDYGADGGSALRGGWDTMRMIPHFASRDSITEHFPTSSKAAK